MTIDFEIGISILMADHILLVLMLNVPSHNAISLCYDMTGAAM